eukprot:8493496-Ditylum_brightwellii.AAC.1
MGCQYRVRFFPRQYALSTSDFGAGANTSFMLGLDAGGYTGHDSAHLLPLYSSSHLAHVPLLT